MPTDDRAPRDSDGTFWAEIFTLRGSVTPYVIRRVLAFGAFSLAIYWLYQTKHPNLGVDLGPYEVVGAVLGLLLVFRTNAGYDRWYEGRQLLGQIVNDTRNLSVTTLSHGPQDAAWRDSVIRWTAAYGHVCRASLRDESVPNEVRNLLGSASADEIERAEHMPLFVALRIGEYLQLACDTMGMDRYGFLAADQERSRLIQHIGACERIRKTPIPLAYAVNIRRFIFLYLAASPFALLDRVGWLTPIVTMLIAYPILSLDQLGVELQSPFSRRSLNHLPMDEITAGIERNLLGLLAASRVATPIGSK